MDYLTVKEAAKLKCCSERYVKTLCKNGKLRSEQQIHPQNKQMCYMIPVSSLSENLQQKWYKQKRSESGLLPKATEEKPEKKKTAAPQRSFEELSADERAEVNLWTEIVRE